MGVMKFKTMYERQGRPSKNYEPDVLQEILEKREAGSSLKSLSEEYKVSISTISRMLRRAKEMVV